jgi:hypothetical protein
MNLNANPTPQQLRELIRRCDDNAGHHVLWVRNTGEVEISRIPDDQSPVGFRVADPEMQIQYEPFLAGNEYVGPEAAADEEWLSELFDSLLAEWSRAKGKPGVAYIDRLC